MSVVELMLADSRTPSGGYAHSGGLEAAVSAGLTVAEVPGYVRARLHTVGLVDAAVASVATETPELDGLLALDAEWAARTPAPPLREAARQTGRALLRVARTWWPSAELLDDYARASVLAPRPVVLGAVGRLGGLAPLAVARLSLYEDGAGVMSAAAKLLPLDSARTSAWLAGLGDELERLAARAVAAGLDASTCTPWLDRRALTHATQERKLFAS